VVVNDLDLLNSCIGPHETDPPLRIDPDTVLTRSVTTESLKAVSRRDSQFINVNSRFEQAELAQRYAMNPRVNRRYALTSPQALSRSISEGPDHHTLPCHT
jgi:hypothetical protein